MKAIDAKFEFNHTHEPGDDHLVHSNSRIFCLKCAGYCSIVPDHILPNWLRKAKHDDVQFRFANSDIPEM